MTSSQNKSEKNQLSSNTNNSSGSGESTKLAENYTTSQSEKALNIFSNILRELRGEIEK